MKIEDISVIKVCDISLNERATKQSVFSINETSFDKP